MRRLTAIGPWLLALLLSAGLAVERLGEVARDPGGVLVCDWTHPDCLGNHWLMVWVAERLSSGASILHNDAYYAPIGDAPWLAGNGSEGFLYLPLHLALGWPTGLGVWALLAVTANGLAGYVLGRAAGAGRWGALVSAAAVGSCVYVVQEMGAGRFTQADVAWAALGLAGVLAVAERPGWARAVAAGGALAVAAILYWYHGMFLALAAALLVGARAATRAPIPWRRLAVLSALALALALPMLAIYLLNWDQIPGTTGPEPFPHPEAIGDALRPEWPFAVQDGRMVSQAMALPVVLLAAVSLGRLALRRSERPATDLGLAAVAAVFYLLAMGPSGPLYEPLYGLAAPLRRFWWPHRHLVMVHLAAAALAARAVPALSGGRAWREAALGVVLALSVSPALRLQGAPTRIHQSPVSLPPDFYVEVAALPGELLLQLPFTPQVASSQTPLIYQLYHHKRMVNGHAPWVDRVRPPAWDAMVQENSFLAGLYAYEQGDPGWPGVAWRFREADLQALINEGLAVIVVDQEHYPLPARALYEGHRALLTELFGPPEVRHKRAFAYHTRGWTGASEAHPPPWTWPPGVRAGGGSQSITARRARSPTFDLDGVEP
ncbi:MAG: hypothetical protein H6739_10010 [Alphaproteobacteria bacterium]|nr:hypothetical protein [Alphaproteobacteria bacterium]